MIEIKEYINHAVLVGLITPTQDEERTREYLDELAFLADTNHIVPVKRFVQRLDQPNTATYVGEGKLQEIKDFIIKTSPTPPREGLDGCVSTPSLRGKGESDGSEISVVIFDDELSPRQLRNIEKELNTLPNGKTGHVRVMDRTILILEIFLQRAQTSYAKTQVEMAHLQYMLPWHGRDTDRGGQTDYRAAYCIAARRPQED